MEKELKKLKEKYNNSFDEFRLFDNDDQELLETLSKENDTQKTNTDISFIDDGESGNFSNNTTVDIQEIGKGILDFEAQFMESGKKIENIKNVINTLNEDEKKKLYSDLGINYDSVSKKNKKKVKPVDKRKAEKSFLNEKAKSITTDILKEIGDVCIPTDEL